MAGIYNVITGILLRGYSRVALSEKGAFRLVSLVRRFMPRDSWCREFMVGDDRRMTLDLSVYPDWSMAYGLYELTTARLIKRLLKHGDHFVDGGANIGYFTMMAAQIVGEQGRVDAFEPQPDSRARLAEHLERNSYHDYVSIHNLALGEEVGEVEIAFFEGEGVNHGCSSIYGREGVEVVSSTKVPMKRMDQVLQGTSPKLVKLDIEGAEYTAILGMEGLLKDNPHPPHIITECNYTMHASHGATPEQFVNKVLEFNPNYTVYRIGRRMEKVNAERLRDVTGGKECNLYFKPSN
ncbi:FkbM family methyltransferase [Poriferisphaera sp. WC338]|uniref:FkbM family methyltransferase n=1 Tax=Poriferisphaera sp. WC338 TaxID=3425129 RepID=UPI003D815469